MAREGCFRAVGLKLAGKSGRLRPTPTHVDLSRRASGAKPLWLPGLWHCLLCRSEERAEQSEVGSARRHTRRPVLARFRWREDHRCNRGTLH